MVVRTLCKQIQYDIADSYLMVNSDWIHPKICCRPHLTIFIIPWPKDVVIMCVVIPSFCGLKNSFFVKNEKNLVLKGFLRSRLDRTFVS